MTPPWRDSCAKGRTCARWSVIERRQIEAAGLLGEARNESQVAGLRGEFDTISRRLDDINAEIASKYPAYAELANPQPLGIADVQKLLQPNEALVIFVQTGAGSYAWAVTRDDVDWIRVALSEEYLAD